MPVRFHQKLITRPGGLMFSPDKLDFDGYPVTPDDQEDLPTGVTRGLHIGSPGDVVCQLEGGGTAVLTGLEADQYVRIAVTRVMAAGTTAADIHALY